MLGAVVGVISDDADAGAFSGGGVYAVGVGDSAAAVDLVEALFEGVAAHTFAPLLLRAALAGVFIYHGLDKVKPQHDYGWTWGNLE